MTHGQDEVKLLPGCGAVAETRRILYQRSERGGDDMSKYEKIMMAISSGQLLVSLVMMVVSVMFR